MNKTTEDFYTAAILLAARMAEVKRGLCFTVGLEGVQPGTVKVTIQGRWFKGETSFTLNEAIGKEVLQYVMDKAVERFGAMCKEEREGSGE